jgi:L-arabinose isomerase
MDQAKAKVGLLPLYLKLYDDRLPERRARAEAFYKQIAGELERRGLEVLTSPICRVRPEFEAAVRGFEEHGAEAILALHLAYSPSLESAETLARSPLPVIVCDTTPAFSCGPEQDPEELIYNHGIRGVQDLCNLLLRYGKPFHVEVGHWQKSDVLKRVARRVQSARMAARVRTLRAGLIGEPFTGVGDFYVSPADLKRHLGVETRTLHPKRFKTLLSSLSEQEINREQEEDRKRFVVDTRASAEAFRRSVRTGLALRKWLEKERLGAFSFNFLNVNKASGLETVPFLEASKMMAAGVGYGGEGDLLTASLVAGLAAANPDTSFTEMFCPDWKNGTVYLSHLGEMNWRLAASRPRLVEMDYRYSEVENPVYVAGRFKPGDILLVNLLPLEPLQEGAYRLLVAPAAMLAVKSKDRMERSVHGWFKPKLPLNEFLAEYSRLGGTHHLAVSYDLPIPVVQTFAEMMRWETVVIG